MRNEFDVDVAFDPFDAVEEIEARQLISDLEATGAQAKIAETHAPPTGVLDIVIVVALIAVTTASAAGLTVMAAFIYRVFRKGVILDLSGDKPQIRKNNDLPRGTLLILHRDGTSELRESLSSEQVGQLIASTLAMRG